MDNNDYSSSMFANQTMHQQIKGQLLERICSSAIMDKLPSERVLAEEFGVSRPTINKVMEALEHEGYISRRVGKGTFVIPRDKAVLKEAGAPRSKGEIIIAYPDYFSFWIWDIVHKAELAAMRCNFNMINLKFQPGSDFESLLQLAVKQPSLRGIIIIPPGIDLPKPLLASLDRLPVPTIVLEMQNQYQCYEHIYEISNNHFKSGFLKMECLLRHGHRNIGMVLNEPVTTGSSEHLRGIKQAVRNYGMRWKDMMFPDTFTQPWQDARHTGYIQARELLDKNPHLTAVLCDTILGAFGVLRLLYERGLKCPDDISIVSGSPDFDQEEFNCPRLSNVFPSLTDTVNAAMEIILNPGKLHGKSIQIDMQMFERESVKKLN